MVIIKISLRSTHVSSQFLKSMMQKCTSDRLVSLSYEQLDFNKTKPSAHECLSETSQPDCAVRCSEMTSHCTGKREWPVFRDCFACSLA